MSQHPFQNFMVRYGAGEPVFAEGEAGNTMFIVQAGRVELFRQINGQRRSVGIMEKGDFFGEMSILEGLPRTHSAEAAQKSELIEINNTIFDKMIRGNIEIAIRMLRKLSIRLREAESKLTAAQADGRAPGASGAVRPAAAVRKPVEATGARLEVSGKAFRLCENETLIGRYDPVTELRPDIDLTDLDLKRSVSRRHARIVRTEDGYVIMEEVGALNGTSVNGLPLVAGQQQAIADGDQIALGTVQIVFRS